MNWSVRYFGIRILPSKKKKSETASDEAENKKAGKKSGKEEKLDSGKKQKKLLADSVLQKFQKFVHRADMAGSAFNALPSALRWAASALTWYAVETDITIANEDAYECAKQYGLMQIILQNLLSQTGSLIHVKRKNIQLRCDFTADESLYQFRCKVKIHIGKTIIAGIVLLWNYFKDSRQAKKSIVRENL